MIRRAGALLVVVFVFQVLEGCAFMGQTFGTGEQAWNTHRESLINLNHWTLQARVASGRIVGWSGTMHWRQEVDHFDIRVSGPLGVGAIQTRGNLGDEVQIRTAKETITTREPETFLHQKLGWSFPLHGLRYWAMGLPDPARPSELKYDHTGRLTELKQDGWTMEYTDYGSYDKYELPRKFTLDNEEVKIRVVVDDWTEFG